MHKDLKNIKNIKKRKEFVYNPTTKEKDKKRRRLFKEQKEKYGFDEREIWNLEFTTITWLYAHLKRLKKWGHSDLYGDNIFGYCKVDFIKKDKENNYVYNVVLDSYEYADPETGEKGKNEFHKIEFEFEEKKVCYGYVIDEILEYFEYFLNNYDSHFDYDLDFEHRNLVMALAKEGMKLYAEILPYLWD